MLTHRTVALSTIVALVALLIGINLIAGPLLRGAEIDLTERRLFTLSGGTKAMLKKLEEPVTLRLYFSEKIAQDFPQVRGYGARVGDLLGEIAAASDGKVELDIIDPEPFSSEEDIAAAYGLTGVPTGTGEKLYLGLVGTNLVDGLETIAFLSPEREEFLEYDIARLIHALSRPERPVLGILTSLPLELGPGGFLAQMQGQARPYVIYEQLRQSFTLEMIEDGADRIPEAVSVLLIAHPGELAPKTLYAIDQFAMRGGRLIVLVDPHAESAAAPGMGGQPMPGAVRTSNLAPLLAQWGVAYDPQSVVFDRKRALSVQFGGGAGAEDLPYVAWLRLEAEDLARDDLVTADIDALQMATSGVLEAAADAKTTFTPLVTTSEESQKESSLILSFGGDPRSLLESFVSGGKKHVIAARVTGPVTSAYPDGPPKEEPKAEDESAGEPKPPEAPLPAHLGEATAPLNLIVVADSDFLEDQFWVEVQDFLGQRVAQPTAGNGFFLVNAIENMMGSDDLISLRSRQSSERPFEVVESLERTASERFKAEEERLRAEIADTEKRLEALRARTGEDGALVPEDGAAPVLTAEEQREVRNFEIALAETRLALREVERALRRDVTALGSWVKVLNIAGVPLLLLGAAAVYGLLRMRSKKGARAS